MLWSIIQEDKLKAPWQNGRQNRDHTFMTSMKNVQFFCLSEWVQIGRDPPPPAPGRRNLGYQQRSPYLR